MAWVEAAVVVASLDKGGVGVMGRRVVWGWRDGEESCCE